MNNTVLSIIKTLSYADCFDYPLTVREIWKYYIGTSNKSLSHLTDTIAQYPYLFQKHGAYIALPHRKSIIALRKKRSLESKKKYIKALVFAKILSYIPTVLCIGISGSLAMNNAKKTDDIDFFFITKKNTLWISRFIVNVVLILLSVKRKKGTDLAPDKICPNMFVSENRLMLSRKNLFTAHEVVQLKVLVNKNEVYERFISANLWVRNFLPHALAPLPISSKSRREKSTNHYLRMFDHIAFKLQKYYMKNDHTDEIIGKFIACFHPNDKTNPILQKYRDRYALHLRVSENILFPHTQLPSQLLEN